MTTSPYGIDRLSEEARQATNKQLDALREECTLYALCFGTEAGMKVLELMRSLLEKQPTWNPEVDPRYGYYREGQNDVIRHIINRINFAKQGGS